MLGGWGWMKVPQAVRCEGYLAACYRDISVTKPFHFSKPNPKSDRTSNGKPGKPKIDVAAGHGRINNKEKLSITL